MRYLLFELCNRYHVIRAVRIVRIVHTSHPRRFRRNGTIRVSAFGLRRQLCHIDSVRSFIVAFQSATESVRI